MGLICGWYIEECRWVVVAHCDARARGSTGKPRTRREQRERRTGVGTDRNELQRQGATRDVEQGGVTRFAPRQDNKPLCEQPLQPNRTWRVELPNAQSSIKPLGRQRARYMHITTGWAKGRLAARKQSRSCVEQSGQGLICWNSSHCMEIRLSCKSHIQARTRGGGTCRESRNHNGSKRGKCRQENLPRAKKRIATAGKQFI